MTARVDKQSSNNMTYITILSNGTGFNGKTVFVTVCYTKTSDTATRGTVEQTRGLTKGETIDEEPIEELKKDSNISGDIEDETKSETYMK
jgi:hypothetical protein